MGPVTTIETVLRRDRVVVTAGLVGVAALGWLYLLYLARGMAGMDMSADMAMPQMQTWGVVDLALLFVMWAVMMVAMMVPSASTLILMVAAANRKRRERSDPLCWVLMALLFVAGVMNLLWVAVISLFVLAEKVLPRGELVGRVGGAALLVAGVVVLTSAV